jgi:hypothetical protein
MAFEWTRTDVTFGEGFLRIAREQISRAAAGALDEGNSPARRIHESRRRCKKLRALFRLVQPDFRRYREENTNVRDAARRLSEVRDANVVQQTLSALMAATDRPVPQVNLAPSDEAAERAALTRFAAEMDTLLARSQSWNISRINQHTIEDGLERTYRSARDVGRATLARPSDTGFHEWRKLAKYHWNHLNLLEDCAKALLTSETSASGALAELLGAHHDLAVLAGILETKPDRLGTNLDVPFILTAISRRQRELEGEITPLGAQVFAETPKALRKRFSAYLTAWRAVEAA